MALSSKKKVAVKNKTVVPKKVSPKKTTLAKKSVTKTVAPVSKKKVPAKKTVVKKTPTKKNSQTSVIAEKTVTEKNVKKWWFFSESHGNSSIITTLLAVLIVAFVVLGGYIYSRQNNRIVQNIQNSPDIFDTTSQQNLPPAAPSLQVAPGVSMTPEMQDILRILPTQLLIGPGEVLQNVSTVKDVALLREQNPTFYKNAVLWDYVLQFKKQTILFRSDTLQVISVELVSSQK